MLGGAGNNNDNFSSFFMGGRFAPATNSYGLFAQRDNSERIIDTTDELTLIGGGRGTLSVPANSFQICDSFVAEMFGHISASSNPTLRILVTNKLSGAVLADSGSIVIRNATNQHWFLNLYFTIRQIGGAGVGFIFTGGVFNYTRDGGTNLESAIFSNGNSTTFNTEEETQLDITAQWSVASASNSIFSEVFTLIKTF